MTSENATSVPCSPPPSGTIFNTLFFLPGCDPTFRHDKPADCDHRWFGPDLRSARVKLRPAFHLHPKRSRQQEKEALEISVLDHFRHFGRSLGQSCCIKKLPDRSEISKMKTHKEKARHALKLVSPTTMMILHKLTH